MGSEEVDLFVQTKVLPEYQPIVAKLRELMRELAPQAREVIAYGVPMYKGRKFLTVINPSKSGVTFSFVYGRQFEDRFGLLRGVGKVSRHVKIKSLGKMNEEALRYYIRQALKVDVEEA
ncbi:MAG: DUF1801 domain-containing protein [Dehalococcoidia bacterium]|jgi:hypothetical protein